MIVLNLGKVVEILEAKVFSGEEKLGDLEIERVGAADMMSDVLAFAKPGMLLITGLNTPQVVRTASIVGIAAVVVVRKKTIPDETVQAGKMFGIPLLHSPLAMYTACGRLYRESLKDINSF
ncbi:MAG TPA: DRTGG domain-containing protein [Thermotogota bacterium]|nr:DRTGG domain-containing protein [Thermotogota bacterium]HRW91812.1 DRTGG domain-containing protein [Thermotogota bacterium]